MLPEIKRVLAHHLAPVVEVSEEEILLDLELPKDRSHGHLALPVFKLAKKLRKAPPVIAKELSDKLNAESTTEVRQFDVVPMGGFLNFTFNSRYLLDSLILGIKDPNALGFSNSGKGKRVIVDYSSPNVAKPLGIGHLRATVIGNAVCNLGRAQGFDVVGLNYLGDWGVQFGKLAWAFENWGSEYPFDLEPFDSLYKLYVRFHEEAELDKELDKKGGQYFKRLEEGDPEVRKLWEKFIEITMIEHRKLYDLLKVKFDLIQGESFYNDKMEAAIDRLEKAGILEESDGAKVVFLNESDPPCLIKKSDGSTLYATRDIASALYRHEVMKGDLLLYVVGQDQTLHFKQVFGVVRKLGYSWADNCHHISFGMYRFKGGKMSTRKGNLVFMKDVLARATEMALEIIQEKNPGLERKETVAEQVGIGAVIFNDLVNDRVKNVEFDWERVLDFEGDSGPYVQYGAVRCQSLLRKYGKEVKLESTDLLSSEEEIQLLITLLSYPEVLRMAWEAYKPNTVAQYLLKVCQDFNHFYNKHRIIGVSPNLESARMGLVHCTSRVLEAGLKILGIPCPERM